MLQVEYTFIPTEQLKNRRLLNRLQHEVGISLSKRHLNSSMFTNISHSDSLVVCAISNYQIGIDVEYKRILSINDFDNRLFPQFVWTNILADNFPSSSFLKYWTSLESALKAAKVGFSISLESICWKSDCSAIEFNGNTWFLKSIFIDDNFHCSVSSNYPIKNIQLVKVNFQNLCVKL